MLNAALKVLGGKQDGKLIPLATKKFLIGREQDCHLRPNSDSVSRHHCVITVDDFTVHVRDLGSSNGTFLNNVRLVGLREANNGDRLRIGSLEFEIVARKGAPTVAAVSAAPSSTGSEFSIAEFGLPDVAPVEETAMFSKSDTLVMSRSELPSGTAAPANELASTPDPLGEPDTATLPPAETQVAPPDAAAPAAAPAYDPMLAAQQAQQQMPTGYDLAAMQAAQAAAMGAYPYGQPQTYPGYGMPMQPQMGYPYGMPQPQAYPPGYGMPQQPGYGMPQMPYGMQYPQQGYPQQAYGYPQQMMPGMAAPQQMAQPEAVEDAAAPKAADTLPVQLPPPEETGYKAPVAQEQKPGDAPKPPPPNPAAEVLKKMMQRR